MEINQYNYTSADLQELAQQCGSDCAKILKIRIIGSEQLRSTKGLSSFSNVEEINFSGNQISQVVDLTGLTKLKVLNLSSNEIRAFPELSEVVRLKKLNLSGNKIKSLKGVEKLNKHSLQSLIMIDNRLSDLSELRLLEQFSHLKELVFQKSNEQTNPFCKNTTAYYGQLVLLNNIENVLIDNKHTDQLLQVLDDGKTKRGGESHFYSFKCDNLNEKPLQQSSNIKESDVEFQKQFDVDSSIKRRQGEHVNVVTVNESRLDFKNKFDSALTYNKEKMLKERENVLKSTNKHLQKKLEEYEIIINQLSTQLKNKENNNTKLNQKTANFENSIKQKDDIIRELNTKLENEVRDKIELKFELKGLKEKNYEKEYEIRSIREQSNTLEIENKKLQNDVMFYKERYDHLDHMQRAQQMNNNTETKNDSLQQLHSENMTLKNNILSLKNQLAMLEDKESLRIEKLELDCEKAYNSKISELENNFKQKEEDYKKGQIELEKTYKENIDGMEKDFKAIIVELTEKNNSMAREINQLRAKKMEFASNYKMLIEKNETQKSEIIKLLQKIEQLDQRRTTGDNYLKEAINSTEKKLEESERQLDHTQKQLNEYMLTTKSLRKDKQDNENYILEMKSEVGKQERELFDLRFKLENQIDKNEMLEKKIQKIKSEFEKDRNQSESVIEGLEIDLRAKRTMLETKNRESDMLKSKLKEAEEYIDDSKKAQNKHVIGLKSQKNELEKEIERAKDKIIRQNELLDEYQKEMEEKVGLIDELREELKRFEDESLLDDFKRQLSAANNMNEAKERRIAELMDSISEFKKSVVDREGQVKFLQNKIEQTQVDCDKRIEHKDSQLSKYKTELIEAQEDVKTLILELERKKKEAKLNLDKLKNLFS